MGLFKKKKKSESKKAVPESKVSDIPELPKLPELPSIGEFNSEESLPQLPSFPNNSLGDKFSQDTIKKAVTGKKEGEEVFDADEFADEEDLQMMQKPLQRPRTKTYEDYEEEVPSKRKSYEMPRNLQSFRGVTKKAEPVFIRLDKFEDAMHTFEKIKEQVSEIEHLLRDTKEIKAKEDEELSSWENEIQSIKSEIEKINQDIFSKIE